MAIPTYAIVIIALASFALGIGLTLAAVWFEQDRQIHMTCSPPNEDKKKICNRREALHWARDAIWLEHEKGRGQETKRWLREEIQKIDVRVKKGRMPTNCCGKRHVYENWARQYRSRGRVAAEGYADRDVDDFSEPLPPYSV